MDLNEYQRLAKRTANTLSPSDMIENGILGMCGESGECADILKKFYYQGHELDREHLKEELGDVLWYVALMATGLQIDLSDVAQRNIDKLLKRYPDGFDPQKSINRTE